MFRRLRESGISVAKSKKASKKSDAKAEAPAAEADGPELTETVEEAVEVTEETAKAVQEVVEPESAEITPEPDIEEPDEIVEESFEDTAKDAENESDPWEKLSEEAAESAEPIPEPVAASPIAAQPEPRSAWPMIISGVLIAGVGYMAGRGDVIDNFLPPSWRAQDPVAAIQPALEDLSAKTSSVGDDLSVLTAKVEAIPAPEAPDFSPVTSQIETLATRIQKIEETPAPAPIITTDGTDLSPINAALQDIAARLTALEEQDQDYSSEFDTLQTTAKTQQEQIAALLEDAKRAEDEAAAAANETKARVALGRIRAALDAGQPFETDLAAFAETGISEVPAALSDVAADGVTTLGTLQVDVADAARTGLAAARTGESATSGLGGFFERQLGVRSLEAREGDDPDAVLSRVVAMMKNGDLEKALTEAELLPDAAREAMSGWLNNAQARVNALTAAADLSASLPTN